MSTAEDKVAAIRQLTYPTTLGKLEHYLGLTGYLRTGVHYYAQLAAPLQELKTRLLKDSPATKGRPRKKYASTLLLDTPTPAELTSFECLQDELSKPSLLVHFNPDRVLWIDLDASKEFGFGVQVFHVKGEAPKEKWPARSQIEPIMYLSRLLTSAERSYWPTELEVAGFVWTIKKIRHLVESSRYKVVIQTDHSAILDIMRQSSITSISSTICMNVRLIRAAQFLRQFQLDVRHKPGKEHIVPDALSRLASTNSYGLGDNHSELDALLCDCLFTASYVRMSDDFHQRIIQGYQDDPIWRRIAGVIDNPADQTRYKLPFVRGRNLPAMDNDPYFEPRLYVDDDSDLNGNEELSSNPDTSIKSDVIDNLIYHIDKSTGRYRVCLPDADTLVKDVLEIIHGAGYPGFEKYFDIISKSWYIRHLKKHIREYLRYCPECLILQTRRHQPYGVLEPIQTPSAPFYTLIIDWILALPITDEGWDCILTATDKYSKRVTFIPGKSIWSAADWALALLDRLAIADWGIPAAIISDRDPKFLSELWTAIFKQLGVNLLYSTAYHPQIDGMSERTNQTAEIALRFYLNTLDNLKKWPSVLPRIQTLMNNTSSASTGHSANDIAYGFSLNKPLDLAKLPPQINNIAVTRVDAADTLSFAQIQQEFHYNRKHQPMFFRTGDKVYLRLYKGYDIPANAAIKRVLGQQYVGPFDIVRRVGSQAYELALPNHWRIHPVVSIAILEPAPGDDPYTRATYDHPDSVFVEGDTPTYKSYIIDRLINRRVIKKGRGYSTQYLVRWRGYGPEYDEWRSVKDLGNSQDLVDEYDRIAATGV